MMAAGKPVPYDTRERIVNAYGRFKNADTVADMFGVSTRTVYRVARQKQETGDVELHLHRRGRKPKLSDEQYEQIRTTLQEKPDMTLMDLIQELELPISESRLSRIIRQLGFRLKKKVIHASEQKRPRRTGEA